MDSRRYAAAECQSVVGTLTYVSWLANVDIASLSDGAVNATLETTGALERQQLDFLSLSAGFVVVAVVAVAIVAIVAVVARLDSTLKAVKVCSLVLRVTVVEEFDTSVEPK